MLGWVFCMILLLLLGGGGQSGRSLHVVLGCGLIGNIDIAAELRMEVLRLGIWPGLDWTNRAHAVQRLRPRNWQQASKCGGQVAMCLEGVWIGNHDKVCLIVS